MKNQRGYASGYPAKEAGADPLGPNSEIGKKLRDYYNGLVEEAVPDRFSQLLSQLEAAESTRDEETREGGGA